jgi:hypothetical protein
MLPGINTLELIIESDENRYLNGASIEIDVLVLVQIDFVFSDLDLVNGQRILQGSVNLTANDTGEMLPGVSMSALLFNFEFKALSPLPPLSDKLIWGDLNVQISSNSIFVDPISLSNLALQGNMEIIYEESDSENILGPFMLIIGSILIVSLLTTSFILYGRRKKSQLSEIANIFSYASELLAAGDEVRSSIFICYQNLCEVLMQRGFLRRGFETVREFELAIRTALPEIREESLIALDRIFEEARYSSHILGENHRSNATLALTSVVDEINSLEEIPNRENEIISDIK